MNEVQGREGTGPRPAPALLRAALLVVGTAFLAVLQGAPQLLLLVVPLLAWALVGLSHRAQRAGQETAAPLAVSLSRRVIAEGGTAELTVTGPASTLTTLSVALPPSADLAPRHGSRTGVGAVRLRATAHRWGRLRLDPVHVQLTDPLGAFRQELDLAPVDLRALPAGSVLDAPLEVPTPIGLSGAHLSRRRGEGTALAEVRAFRPGDRLHRINWRVSSRTGELHTNAAFTERDTEVLILTDTISDLVPPPEAGPDAATSLDLTIRATYAVAAHYLALGDRVALFDLGHLIGPVPAAAGPRQLRLLTDALSRAHRDDGSRLPARRLRSVRPGTLAVLASPLLHDVVIDQIGMLVAHGADVLVVDTLPRSLGDAARLPQRPRPDQGRDRFWAEAWVLRRLLRERTVRELAEAGVPVTTWEGPASLAPLLTSLVAARRAPRRRRS